MQFASLGFLFFALALSACNRDIPEGGEPSSVIDSGEREAGAGLYSSVVVDERGAIHVAYYHADQKSLRYATWNGKSWKKTTVDGGKVNRGRQARLVLADSTLYIAYQDVDADSVMLASKVGAGDWKTEVVDESSFQLGDFLDVAVVNGAPRVAYFDSSNSDLMIADKNRDGSWTPVTVDTKGDVGRYVSMEASFDGRTGIAYYDGVYGGLKYAERTASGFVRTEVDGFSGGTSDAVGVGTWTKIRMQPRGSLASDTVDPKILYYDDVRHRLLLAEREGGAEGTWKRSVVDDEGYVGTDNSFVWLEDGSLLAVYFDATHNDLKMARRTGGGWTRQTLLSQGAVGLYNSIDFVPGGKVAVTTYNLSKGQLNYLLLPVRP